MSEKITLVNKRTYHIKTVNVGMDWCWSLFLSPFLLTIPLLIRKLYEWAILMMVLFLINTSLIYMLIFLTQSWIIFVLLTFTMSISLVCQIFLANNGNNISFTRHMEKGWEIKDR